MLDEEPQANERQDNDIQWTRIVELDFVPYPSVERPDIIKMDYRRCHADPRAQFIQEPDGKRDPKMHQTKKGNQYYFGMKAHIGVDDESGLVHSVVVAAAPLRALFAPATASATLLLWLCYFFTLLVVYMLINWLPMLLVEQGFRPSQAAGVMFALQIGAASGTLILGALMDKLRPVVMSLLIYTGMLASLLALGTVSSLSGMLMAGFVAGMFATGGQKCVVCAGAAVLQHADPRHRRGNRRRSRASGGDERSAAGRENVSARYRNGRGDGGFCAGHFAGRLGGIYSDEPQITDADPGQRCLSIHPVVGVGRFDSHFRVNAVSQLWCQSLDKTWQRRRYELAALFVSDY